MSGILADEGEVRRPLRWGTVARYVGPHDDFISCELPVTPGDILKGSRTGECMRVLVRCFASGFHVVRAVGDVNAAPLVPGDALVVIGTVYRDPDDDRPSAIQGTFPGGEGLD